VDAYRWHTQEAQEFPYLAENLPLPAGTTFHLATQRDTGTKMCILRNSNVEMEVLELVLDTDVFSKTEYGIFELQMCLGYRIIVHPVDADEVTEQASSKRQKI